VVFRRCNGSVNFVIISKKKLFRWTTASHKFLIKTLQGWGPRIDSWGTPEGTSEGKEIISGTRTKISG
jgi:hypothetical protein